MLGFTLYKHSYPICMDDKLTLKGLHLEEKIEDLTKERKSRLHILKSSIFESLMHLH